VVFFPGSAFLELVNTPGKKQHEHIPLKNHRCSSGEGSKDCLKTAVQSWIGCFPDDNYIPGALLKPEKAVRRKLAAGIMNDVLKRYIGFPGSFFVGIRAGKIIKREIGLTHWFLRVMNRKRLLLKGKRVRTHHLASGGYQRGVSRKTQVSKDKVCADTWGN